MNACNAQYVNFICQSAHWIEAHAKEYTLQVCTYTVTGWIAFTNSQWNEIALLSPVLTEVINLNVEDSTVKKHKLLEPFKLLTSICELK